jgi:hypothetical protein
MERINSQKYAVYSISSSNTIIGTTSEQFAEQRNREFSKMLAQMYNEHILPRFGQEIRTMDIYLGLFTSDQYGSYKISFYSEEEKEVCYVIADTILGEWKLFKTETE